MKKMIFLITLSTISISVLGQTFELKFDHTAILVSDLQKSAEFYTDILQLSQIETPGSNQIIRWFSLGKNRQLHLVKVDNDGIKLHKAIHFSLNVANYDAFLKYLESKIIEYSNWPGEKNKFTVRADGVRQIYIQDPDGHWIEINDAVY
ncbi:MAG: VOC family protein [Bacteroidetes bacterium]|nr:VOC family protein [Bacteroidota bacterium]MCZ6900600.1 VOC family protein [Bacteroidota bacterium]